MKGGSWCGRPAVTVGVCTLFLSLSRLVILERERVCSFCFFLVLVFFVFIFGTRKSNSSLQFLREIITLRNSHYCYHYSVVRV